MTIVLAWRHIGNIFFETSVDWEVKIEDDIRVIENPQETSERIARCFLQNQRMVF
jgi:hypothetical protein